MSNIVERLRSPATVFYEYAADNGAFLREAADAIEALLAERERCAKELTEACELLHRLTAIIPGNDGAGEEVAKFLRAAAIRSGK